MQTIIHIRQDTVIPLAALAGLLSMAAGRDPVVVATQSAMPPSRRAALAKGLAPSRMATVTVDDHVPPADRALIEGMIEDGVIPVILTACDPPPTNLTSWLDRARHPGPPGRRRLAAVPRR